ncbi:MAG TPA: DMT family transporter [Steroidobacteraceae bacterium]|jgi:transporter family-2 protein|nr:DMT family transporter [Steroidobacteraceae bacterium]
MSTVSYAIWAFAAGALIPLMALLNAGVARTVGGQIQATVILFATGLIASLLLAVMTTVRLPDLHTLGRVAPHQYAGGVIVGFYVLSVTFLAPRFGVANAIMFAVTAQLITSALIDHFALAGATLRPLTTMRALGLLIVIGGVVITQISDRQIGRIRQVDSRTTPQSH